jgi:sialate O-acetylesterase
MKTSPLLAFVLLALASAAPAAEKLPAIFSDHAVLQRQAKVPVWGWADPSEEITVSVAGQTQTTKAGADGKWKVQFENLTGAGPQTLTVKGASNTLTAQDILIGEVWLGSGQSNMAFTVNRANDFEKEKAAATTPEIRVFTEKSNAAATPQEQCSGSWAVCSPDTVGTFSATAFFFGREIYKELKVPVGLINSSVGGTPIESWIDAHAQEATPELKGFAEAQAKTDASVNMDALKAKYEKDLAAWNEKVAAAKAEGKKPEGRAPKDPTVVRQRKGNIGGLFNGKIAPLIPYAIRGALWYQGEANAAPAKAPFYQYQLPLLVKDWRARWGYEFPFAWVQLPNYTRGDGWCQVREAELKTLALPKTGMAITLDIGMPNNIHPTNKQGVGKRLAMWALGSVYGKDVATSGPLPAGHEIKDSTVIVKFTHTDGGLVAKDGALKGFVLAGEDKQWHDAQAKIEGDEVIVTCADVPHPVACRYAWKDNPDCNLYNGAGLPATQFRTDDWPPPAEAPVAKKPRAKAAPSAAAAAK